MSNESDTRGTPCLAILLESSLEIENQSLKQQLSNVGKLCVDNSCQSCLHMGEVGIGYLGLKYCKWKLLSIQCNIGNNKMLFRNCPVVKDII